MDQSNCVGGSSRRGRRLRVAADESLHSDDEQAAPRSDKALVHFLRPGKVGYAIHAAVYDDQEFIGMVPYGQKLPYYADPGEHLFMVVSEAADFLKADLKAGKTYYIQVVPRMGAWRARFSLAPFGAARLQDPKARSWIDNARLIKNTEAAHTWAEQNHANVMKKREAYLAKWNTKPDSTKPTLLATDGE